jgi:hypothetical protein
MTCNAQSVQLITKYPVSGLDLQHEHAVADDVDYRGLAQLAIRHGLAVRVDVAMHQQPRLQRGDHLVQALEAVVRLVLTVAAMPWRGVGEQDVDAAAVAPA